MIKQFFSKICRSTWGCLLMWLVAVLIFFSPSVFNKKVIAPIDCLECVFRPYAVKPIENVHNQFVIDGVSQYLPYNWSVKQSFEQDGYVGWNPYTYNGAPIADNTMICPGSLHHWLYAILPFWTAWDLGIISQFFIAGAGMILLLRYFKIPIWIALFAAISFAFYSQFVVWIYHRWMSAMIWAPYLVWAFYRYKKFIVNVPAIIFMALLWRSGHLQACTFAFILVVCLWISDIWKKDGKWLSKKEIIKITFSYFITGVLGGLLSLDVFVDTIPRMEGCKNMPFVWGGNNLPSLIMMLFPNALGVPQTMDIMKFFDLSLFDLKYSGGVAFLLALIGCFNSRAPRAPKVLFWVSLVLACSPLVTYLYSRSTVVMALGVAWLAAWQLYDLTRFQPSSICWKRIGAILFGIVVLWLFASVLLYCCKDAVMELAVNKINSYMKGYSHAGREQWQLMRVERFIDYAFIWHWKNIILLLCLLLGMWFCYKIKAGNDKNLCWIRGVVILSFVEILLYSSSWMSYADKPNSSYLYNEPAWMPELRQHVKDGSVEINRSVNDADFLSRNHLSTYGVRLSYGYETAEPKYLRPCNQSVSDTQEYAMAGISHILVDTKWKDVRMPGWNLVMKEKEFKLFENPDYKGRYIIDNKDYIKENWRTYNRIHLTIPKSAHSLTILESYHSGWKAYLAGEEVKISQTERGGMFIEFPANKQERSLLLEFHMPYRKWYHSVMLCTLVCLLIIAVKQKKDVKQD